MCSLCSLLLCIASAILMTHTPPKHPSQHGWCWLAFCPLTWVCCALLAGSTRHQAPVRCRHPALRPGQYCCRQLHWRVHQLQRSGSRVMRVSVQPHSAPQPHARCTCSSHAQRWQARASCGSTPSCTPPLACSGQVLTYKCCYPAGLHAMVVWDTECFATVQWQAQLTSTVKVA